MSIKSMDRAKHSLLGRQSNIDAMSEVKHEPKKYEFLFVFDHVPGRPLPKHPAFPLEEDEDEELEPPAPPGLFWQCLCMCCLSAEKSNREDQEMTDLQIQNNAAANVPKIRVEEEVESESEMSTDSEDDGEDGEYQEGDDDESEDSSYEGSVPNSARTDNSQMEDENKREPTLFEQVFGNCALCLRNAVSRHVPHKMSAATRMRKIDRLYKEFTVAFKRQNMWVKGKISSTGKNKFLLVGASDTVLERVADRIELRMPLKAENGGGMMAYDRGRKSLFQVHENNSVFSAAHRQELVKHLIIAPEDDMGCHFKVKKLIRQGFIQQFFPLHDLGHLKELKKSWNAPMPQEMPKVVTPSVAGANGGSVKNAKSKAVGNSSTAGSGAGALHNALNITEEDHDMSTKPLSFKDRYGFWCCKSKRIKAAERRDRMREEEVKWSYLDRVQKYFGEEICLYFAFLDHYTQLLSWPALAGVGVFAYQMVLMYFPERALAADSFYDNSLTPIYIFFLILWAAVFLQGWKRSNWELALKWHMLDYYRVEGVREEFKDYDLRLVNFEKFQFQVPIRVNKHTLNEKYYPSGKRLFKQMTTTSAIMFCVVFVLAIVVAIQLFRVRLRNNQYNFNSWQMFLAGQINTVTVLVFGYIYRTIATALNDWENHRTQTDYQNALVIKTFLFQFVNSYFPLFFLAFWPDDGYTGEQRMKDIFWQLLGILSFGAIIGNIKEYFIPTIKQKLRSLKMSIASGGQVQRLSWEEQQALMSPYDGCQDDYAELVIQYGFVTLFAPGFPLGALFALLNNVGEKKVDAAKLTDACQRPFPKGASNIGTWLYVLQAIQIVSVVTNTGMMCFTSDALAKSLGLDPKDKFGTMTLLMFLVIEHVTIICVFLINYFMPEMPGYVKKKLAWQEYCREITFESNQKKTDAESSDSDADEDDGASVALTQRSGRSSMTARSRRSAAPLDPKGDAWRTPTHANRPQPALPPFVPPVGPPSETLEIRVDTPHVPPFRLGRAPGELHDEIDPTSETEGEDDTEYSTIGSPARHADPPGTVRV